jgi:cyclopentanol dehydrogenase
MGKCNGKVVIVTGAAGGISFQAAKKFAEEGAKVVLTDLNEELLASGTEILKAGGGDVMYIKHDVTSEESWKNVFDKVKEQYGKVNVLVNGAGILTRKSVREEDASMMEKAHQVMVFGMFKGIQTALPYMEETKEPCAILNIASVVGSFVGTGSSVAYNTAKGAVNGMTKAIAVDLAGTNIRINQVHPGTILTPMTAAKLESDEAYRAAKVAKIPVGRVGLPEEVANAIVFLCSDEASYIHGASLVIDGGQILGFVNGLSENNASMTK